MKALGTSDIRNDFPILQRKLGGKPLVYLDNASTSQKPKQVLDAMDEFYRNSNANVMRSTNSLGLEATEIYHGARNRVAEMIGASPKEVIFTRGTTEGLNVLARILTKKYVCSGGKVITSILEHHSNILPWRNSVSVVGAKLAVLPANRSWTMDLDRLEAELSDGADIVTTLHVSNVLGTINPVKEICRLAHDHGALVVLDSAQGVPHMPVDVKEIDVDFMVFSSHKMLGPTGVGVLYGKQSHLEDLEPWELGGGMVKSVTADEVSYEDLPTRLEAGTPNIAGVIGLAAAVNYLQDIGMQSIVDHERRLLRHAFEVLPKEILELYGPTEAYSHSGMLAFNVKGIHPHDVASALDKEGIIVRAGHHCAQPLVNALGTTATVRASFYLYNSHEEVDLLGQGLRRSVEILT